MGITNLFGSFLQAYPVTGSFSRSAVNAACGVRTLLAKGLSVIIVTVALVGLAPSFYYIPQTSLAAMTLVAVSNMVDFDVSFSPFENVSYLYFVTRSFPFLP
eukprot:m.622131 g.622131  ORF g.622131 m.622131 type:complete len:102 (-) comp58217_c0_seq6:1046-1351(-)